jgi:hypothetical protein
MSAGPSTVEVEVGDEPAGAEARADAADQKRRKRETAAGGVEVEIAREETKRQLIQSVTSIVVVVLYMIFTLLRDRESGVVVVDPDEGGDDWEE